MKKKISWNSLALMLKSFISLYSSFLMLKINVLIKDLPNSESPKIQSPKILCHSLQKKRCI